VAVFAGGSDTRRENYVWTTQLVWVCLITEMIEWAGLAKWIFELRFPGSLISTFLEKIGWP